MENTEIICFTTKKMFLLKKIISPFFMPVTAVLLLAILGLFCLGRTGNDRSRRSVVRSRRTEDGKNRRRETGDRKNILTQRRKGAEGKRRSPC